MSSALIDLLTSNSWLFLYNILQNHYHDFQVGIFRPVPGSSDGCAFTVVAQNNLGVRAEGHHDDVDVSVPNITSVY